MNHLEVHALEPVDDMRGQLRATEPRVREAAHRAEAAMAALIALAEREVAAREAALAHCAPEDRAYFERRLQIAVEALSRAAALTAETSVVCGRAIETAKSR